MSVSIWFFLAVLATIIASVICTIMVARFAFRLSESCKPVMSILVYLLIEGIYFGAIFLFGKFFFPTDIILAISAITAILVGKELIRDNILKLSFKKGVIVIRALAFVSSLLLIFAFIYSYQEDITFLQSVANTISNYVLTMQDPTRSVFGKVFYNLWVFALIIIPSILFSRGMLRWVYGDLLRTLEEAKKLSGEEIALNEQIELNAWFDK